MPRHTRTISITVDVDDPITLRSAALRDASASVDLGLPSLEETVSAVIVDAIADYAAPQFARHGLHAVVISDTDVTDHLEP